MHKQTTVAVAMSGGVDSSVAAALLLEKGFNVIGLMMDLWRADGSSSGIQIERAQNVASVLGISLEVIDIKDVFKRQVVGYYLESQKQGKTPNPCFFCNQKIKWGLLLESAIARGANYLTTGHYARVVKSDKGIFQLYKAFDQKKDQSYVLAGLSQEQLSRALLPLGEKTKVEVREIAHRYNLSIPDDEESQDLCFLGDNDQATFLETYLNQPLLPGEIIDQKGRIVGTHKGLSNYTIGQRKGLGAGNSEAVYVIGKDIQTNTITIGPSSALGSIKALLRDVNWIDGKPLSALFTCTLKIRYKARLICGTIVQDDDGKTSVIFEELARDATPGQFIVFYDGERVIGSGEIEQVFREAE